MTTTTGARSPTKARRLHGVALGNPLTATRRDARHPSSPLPATPQGRRGRQSLLTERLFVTETGRERSLLDIRLFGPPAIYRNGVQVPMPPRLPAKALKILALRGGVIHCDTMAGLLWPDDNVALGRRRLRDLLSKARRATGAAIQERNDTVRVLDELRCDVVLFIQMATRALADIDDPREVNRLCIEAQSLWVGPPLEEDKFEPWARTHRRRAFDLQKRLWALLPPSTGVPGDST